MLFGCCRCVCQVRNAMNEINASKRLKEAARERAEGDKILLVKAAVRHHHHLRHHHHHHHHHHRHHGNSLCVPISHTPPLVSWRGLMPS
jgi:G3E family GTPase